MKWLVVLIALSLPAFADPVSSYTTIGTGGVSGPVANFSNSSFAWADNTGGVNASTLSSTYGYGVFQDGSSYGTGSLLLSNPFTVSAGSTLSVNFSLFTSQNPMCQCDYGFGVLLQNSHLVAVLGASRMDGIGLVGAFGPFPFTIFAGPSAGVSTTITNDPSLAFPHTTLGSQTYGTLFDTRSCNTFPCVTEITSTYAPAAGTYQLLFGSFSAFDAPPQHAASAIAVKSVQVPEGPAIEYIALALLAIGGICLKKRFAPVQVSRS